MHEPGQAQSTLYLRLRLCLFSLLLTRAVLYYSEHSKHTLLKQENTMLQRGSVKARVWTWWMLVFASFTSSVICASAYGETGPGYVTYLSEDGSIVHGIRCGVIDRSPPIDVLIRMKKIGRRLGEHTPEFGVNIPVAFHVIHSSTGEGDVPNSQLQDQIDVSNQSYAGTGFSFSLASIERIQDDEWFTRASIPVIEREMKEALAIDPAHTLNFYTLKPLGGLLGWAYLPWDFPESDPLHGVCVLYSSLPGGAAFPYDEGHTGTHEIGHYLGLLHTFENGCRRPGDYLRDTPYEGEPAFGCPEGRDTCRLTSAERTPFTTSWTTATMRVCTSSPLIRPA
jgi:hypothetical protein